MNERTSTRGKKFDSAVYGVIAIPLLIAGIGGKFGWIGLLLLIVGAVFAVMSVRAYWASA